MTNKYSTLTQKHLKELLSYNPETGLFTWKVMRGPRSPVGTVCKSNNANGYITIRIHDKLYYSHRLAFLYMNGEFPIHTIDHINGICHDNRFINLRDVPHKINHRNSKRPSNNTSGSIGVCWIKSRNKWHAQIMVNRKHIFIGSFTHLNDAIMARKNAEMKHKFHKNHGR